MSEVHLMIVWQYARKLLENIIQDLSQKFVIKDVVEVRWSKSHFSENLTRFYGQNLPPGCSKEQHVGNGPFHAIVFVDDSPIYQIRQTTKGAMSVNVNSFDAKQKYREWTGGGHRIHATNSPLESKRDIWLLFGRDLNQFENTTPWKGTIRRTKSDLLGATGWKDLTDYFNTLNRLCNYVVLRNFEAFPDQLHLDSHGDIDLLVENLQECVYLSNASKIFKDRDRVHYSVKIGGQNVLFDFRYLGDSYYDAKLEQRLLTNRRLLQDIFYAPRDDDYFFSLLYHALIHKKNFSDEYAKRLTVLGDKINVKFDCSPKSASLLLARYFYQNAFEFVRPKDKSVFFNEKWVGYQVEAAEVELIEKSTKVFQNAENLALFSTEVKKCCIDLTSSYSFSPSRANILRPFEKILKKAKVLEIGAGCGAVTRYLGELGSDVVSIELSVLKSEVARLRTKDLQNVQIINGTISEISFKQDFDVIILIGALSDAYLYMSGNQQAYDMLCYLKDRLLAEDGILLIAIDNQLGLKYFAGIDEILKRYPMATIEGVFQHNAPMVYGRKSLEKILEKAGFCHREILIPFPDYRLASSIITEKGIRHEEFNAAALAEQAHYRTDKNTIHPNFIMEFAWREIFKNGLEFDLANSFLISASGSKNIIVDPDVLAYHYSTDRAKEYCKKTEFKISASGKLLVLSEPLKTKRQSGCENDFLKFCPQSESDYEQGELLLLEFNRQVAKNGWSLSDAVRFFSKYIAIIKKELDVYNSKNGLNYSFENLPGDFFDLIPQNIILKKDGSYSIIDKEWKLKEKISIKYLLFRAVVSLNSNGIRICQNKNIKNLRLIENLIAACSHNGIIISEDDIKNYFDIESKIQKIVSGSSKNEIVVIADKIKNSNSRDAQAEKSCDKNNQSELVSIVILTFNNLEYTKKCIESIRKHTPEDHEIIFIDNGSTDGTVKWLKQLVKIQENYKLVENIENYGFSRGCNQGIEASSGNYVLLLNNDVVVTSGWLSGMLACLKASSNTGIVGPMTNNISGPQKVVEPGYSSLQGLDEYAEMFRKKHHNRIIFKRRIVGFCMLFRKKLVEEIGLFDESYGSGNFEDDDFCLRASLKGYQNAIAGDVFIHHYGSRTFIHNRIDYGTSLTTNRKLFTQKWSRADILREFGIRLRIQQAIEKANEFQRKGDLEKSAASLIDAISQAPEERCLYLTLAEMLIESKRFNDALGILESMPREEGDIRQLSLLGKTHEELGNFEKAYDYSTQVLRINPTNGIALNVIGILEYKEGQKDKAEKLFKKAILANPSSGESFTNLGSLKWESGLREEAIELIEHGFILSPIVGDVSTAYHTAVLEMKYFDRAIPLFIDARALYPNDKRINFLLIAMLIQKGTYESAMIEIENSMVQFGIDEGIISAGLEIRNKVGTMECAKGKKRACLSLCMIVKNEEKNIANCMMSLKPLVDEMIVVDTGSTDKTKDIAKVFGAKVYDYEWTEDFSEARNFSLSKATGDWILIMDADEVIASQDYEGFRRIISSSSKKKAYIMITRNYTIAAGNRGWQENDGQYSAVEAGLGWIPSPKVRLFPNRRDIFFSNPVHELVEPSLKNLGMKIVLCTIPIHHYGKMNRAKVVEKGKKYYELGVKKLEDHKNDHRALTELGIQASELGEHEEAIRIWKRVLEIKPDDAVALMSLGSAHLMMYQYEDALKYSFNALEIDPQLREAALNYAVAQMIVGDIRIAKEYLIKIIEKDPNYPPAYARLSAVWLMEGCLEEGKACLERIQSKGYSRLYTIEKQAKELVDVGKKEKAEKLILSAKKIGIASEKLDTIISACRIKTLPAVNYLQEKNGSRESVPIGL